MNDLTHAEAQLLAGAMRSGLPHAARDNLERAIELARSCPMVDAVDVFCDAVAEMVPMEPAERVARLAQLRNDIEIAATPSR